MDLASQRGASDQSEELAKLRTRVMRAGACLGWAPPDVASFAQALTGRSWEACGEAEIEAVLGEYQDLIDVIEDRRNRKGGRRAHLDRTPATASGD